MSAISAPKAGKKRPADDSEGGASASAPPRKKAGDKASKGVPDAGSGAGAGAGSSSSSSAAVASTIPSVTGNASTDMVLHYMRKQNRPYSSIQISENLHNAVNRKAVDLSLMELAERGLVTIKEFNKNVVAWISQKELSSTDTDSREATRTACVDATAKLQALTARRKALEVSVKALEAVPKLSVVTAEAVAWKAKAQAMSQRLGLAKAASDTAAYTPELKQKYLQTLTRLRNAWAERKGLVLDALDAITDGSDRKDFTPKSVAREMGLSMDESVQLKDVSVQALAIKLGVAPASLMPAPTKPKPGAGAKSGAGAGASSVYRPPAGAGAGGSRAGPAPMGQGAGTKHK